MDTTLLYTLLIGLICTVALNLLLTFRLIRIVRSAPSVGVPVDELPLTLPVGEPTPAFGVAKLTEPYDEIKTNQTPTVLIFLSSGCKDCRKKLPELSQIQPAMAHAGVTMWLVSTESEPRVRKFLKGSDLLEQAVVIDPQMRKRLNPRSVTPFYLFLDQQRILQASGVIGDDDWLSFMAQMQEIGEQAGIAP